MSIFDDLTNRITKMEEGLEELASVFGLSGDYDMDELIHAARFSRLMAQPEPPEPKKGLVDQRIHWCESMCVLLVLAFREAGVAPETLRSLEAQLERKPK